mgnify:FL=1
MPMYTGKTRDGSDMKEVEGMYVNPDNDDEWSSEPYPAQVKLLKPKNAVMDYMGSTKGLDDVYKEIKNKTCKLSASLRKYVLTHYDNNGNFIADE